MCCSASTMLFSPTVTPPIIVAEEQIQQFFFMVMGFEGAKKVLERNPDLMAYLIYDDKGQNKQDDGKEHANESGTRHAKRHPPFSEDARYFLILSVPHAMLLPSTFLSVVITQILGKSNLFL